MQRLKITDHALSRYMERCAGMDVESLKRQIIPPGLEQAVDKNGGDYEGVYMNVWYVVRDYKLMTLYPVQRRYKERKQKYKNIKDMKNEKRRNSNNPPGR